MGQALKVIEDDGRPALSLDLPASTTFEEWLGIGRWLCLGQQAVNWQIGDWWAFGDHRYGERAKAAAEGVFGREFQTLANLASVARRFETSRRRETLSFTHHAEVVALPPQQADELLMRAERERMSAVGLRREVVAIRTANENTAGERDTIDVEKQPKSPPQPLDQRELITAYETVVEFADALRQHRDLTRRESDLLTVALAYLQEANADRRQRPADFEVIFVEKGRVECETWYGASRITVNRWLIESGKRRLIELRAAFVKHQRESAPKPKECALPALDGRPVPAEVARLASDFLRQPRNGGWIISATGQGDWWVGQSRRSTSDMVDLAIRKGFDVTVAEASSRERDYLMGQLG